MQDQSNDIDRALTVMCNFEAMNLTFAQFYSRSLYFDRKLIKYSSSIKRSSRSTTYLIDEIVDR